MAQLVILDAYALTGDEAAARKTFDDFKAHNLYRDLKLTLATVKVYEEANPNSNPVIVEGRKKFHEGLLKAGMSGI